MCARSSNEPGGRVRETPASSRVTGSVAGSMPLLEVPRANAASSTNVSLPFPGGTTTSADALIEAKDVAGLHSTAWSDPVAVLLQPTIRPPSSIAAALLWSPPSAPRSTIPTPALHRNACWAPSSLYLVPTTSPLSLTAVGLPFGPSAPRSAMPPPAVQEKPWFEPSAAWLVPTTCPLSLTAAARLKRPPSVPRSTMPSSAVQENACSASRVWLQPTTWPPSLTASALLVPKLKPLGSLKRVPRSTMPPAGVQENACGAPAALSDEPT